MRGRVGGAPERERMNSPQPARKAPQTPRGFVPHTQARDFLRERRAELCHARHPARDRRTSPRQRRDRLDAPMSRSLPGAAVCRVPSTCAFATGRPHAGRRFEEHRTAPARPPLPRPLSPAAREKGENSNARRQTWHCARGAPPPTPPRANYARRGENSISRRKTLAVLPPPRGLRGRVGEGGACGRSGMPVEAPRSPALQSAKADFATFPRRIHSLPPVARSASSGERRPHPGRRP